jgi:hypothetical protein
MKSESGSKNGGIWTGEECSRTQRHSEEDHLLSRGFIDRPKFDQSQLSTMKTTCQRHCFSTLNYNFAYCYHDARVIKWLWSNGIKNKFQGGVCSFED